MIKRPRTLTGQRKNVRRLAKQLSPPLTEARVRVIAAEEASRLIRHLRIVRGDR